MKLLAVALFCGLSFSVLADGFPTRVDISYSIRSGALEGEANDTLEIRQENDTRGYDIDPAVSQVAAHECNSCAALLGLRARVFGREPGRGAEAVGDELL